MRPIIVPFQGLELTAQERDLFRALQPFGFLIYRRNVETIEQMQRLTDSLRELTGREDVPILIDQEGGRVQRLRAPIWADLPDLRRIGDLYQRDAGKGEEAARLHTQIIAGMLVEIGVNTNCAPVLDVPIPGAHDVIDNRAFSLKADVVSALGKIVTATYLENGVVPIIKHMPGHGRAEADTHDSCPVVATDLATLQETDFLPFRDVIAAYGDDSFWAMTAHVLYNVLDDRQPVTTSHNAMRKMRELLNFNGIIVSDSVEMKALEGTIPQRAACAIDAGCDLTMLGHAFLEENKNNYIDMLRDTLEVLPPVSDNVIQLGQKIEAKRKRGQNAYDWREGVKELNNLLQPASLADYKSHDILTDA